MNSKTLKIFVVIIIVMQIFIGQVYAKDKNESKNEVTEEESVAKTEDSEEETVVTEKIKAKVVEAGSRYEKEEDGVKSYYQDVTVKILEGSRAEEKFEATYEFSTNSDNKVVSKELSENDVVYVTITEENKVVSSVKVTSIVRQKYIFILVLLFLASILLIGRKTAIKYIISIIIAIATIIAILVLHVVQGYNAVVLTIIASIIIAIVNFFIFDGLNKKALSGVIGTLGGVVLAGILIAIFTAISKFTGREEETIVLYMSGNDLTFKARQVLFATIIVSSLGACMDIARKVILRLSELKASKREVKFKELFSLGMKVAEEQIGSIINIILFVFLGCFLSMTIVYMKNGYDFWYIINIQTITIDIMIALISSIGVIYTAPITSIAYAFLNRDKEIYKTKSDNIVEGKRSLKL